MRQFTWPQTRPENHQPAVSSKAGAVPPVTHRISLAGYLWGQREASRAADFTLDPGCPERWRSGSPGFTHKVANGEARYRFREMARNLLAQQPHALRPEGQPGPSHMTDHLTLGSTTPAPNSSESSTSNSIGSCGQPSWHRTPRPTTASPDRKAVYSRTIRPRTAGRDSKKTVATAGDAGSSRSPAQFCHHDHNDCHDGNDGQNERPGQGPRCLHQ